MAGKKLTNDEFILRSKAKFGDKFDYSKVDYRGKNYEVTIGCPTHGYVLIKAGYHLDLNYGCPECQKLGRVSDATYNDEIWKDITIPVESVLAIYKDGTTKLFNSLKEASVETGLSTASIRRRCNSGTGKKSKDGLRFQWANEHTKKSKLASKNRNKGNRFELEVVNKLKEIGYNGCVTARSESKRTDNNKIDIIDLNNELQTNIQTKYLMNCPNYFNIKGECNDTSKPFTIIWKKSTNTGENSPGTIAMIDVEYFYHLLKLEKFVKDQNIDINL